MSKIFRMDVLGADYGDCLWVEYGEEEAPHRVLIDGGTKSTFSRLETRLDAVRSVEPSHELLIVTHVDEDHIGGALQVLESPELAAQFKHVWFNARRHLDIAAGDEAFHGGHGELLSTEILKRELPWNQHFDGRPVMRNTVDLPVAVALPGGATITVVTPNAAQLVNLIDDWDKAVTKAGINPAKAAVPPENVEGEESFGMLDVERLAEPSMRQDTATANGSSISVLIEYDGKRMLLAADAHPVGLIAGIKGLGLPLPLKVDVFKLPHHGSKFNVTSELLALVETKVIVFSSNGKKFHHPDREAVARVVKRYGVGVEMVFNYASDETIVWDDHELKSVWGYTTRYGVAASGVSLSIF